MIKVLHVLDHFLPISSGYTFRSKYMLESQRRILGVLPVLLTSPQNGSGLNDQDDWDGIRIYRTKPKAGALSKIPMVKEVSNMVNLGRRVLEIAAKEKVDVIHAHSPVLNAWPAIWAGRKLGIPVVYEIRAFWEDAAVLHGSAREDGLRYRATRVIETLACKSTQAVVTICEGLKQQLLQRKIASEKIFVLPNGVDTEKFLPRSDGGLRQRLGLEGKRVIGFIGSLYRYEGLAQLIKAMANIAPAFPDLHCVIVGEGFGEEVKELSALAGSLGVSDRMLFTGKVPHTEVLNYYATMDILVYPRIRSRLLELVTPLKILEALSMQKAVVGSDVGGIKEIIENGANGMLFKADDPEDLSRILAQMLRNPAETARLGANGREYVKAQRIWDNLIENHRLTYRYLGLPV